MLPLSRVRRLLRINQIFVRHDLDTFVSAIHLFRPYRWLLRMLPWRWFRGERKPRAVRLREALEELGPIFVKFGQMLSTRPDLLPDDVAGELARLQDRVPPYPGEEAVRIIERAYGDSLDKHFSQFDRTPVASASVAQVHFATLHDGTEVAVKVLRPGIQAAIERDLELLYTVARLAVRYSSEARRLRPVEVVREFDKTLHDETDLMREAANASQLRSNFTGSDLLYVPKVFWDHTRHEVMVMERIHGIPISEVDALKAAGIDMRRLAHNGVEIFFTQAFRDGFFHADMHPGNIFVTPEGQYRAVDFGIMGTLSDKDKRYLAENFVAFFNRDYRAVAEAHLRAGWVPPETAVEDFEAAIRAVCEPIFAKPIKDISFGRLLMHLFQTARRFRMEIQPQLVLLEKTLFQIEGLGRRLYPDLDLWVTAKPFLEAWMREQLGPRALVKALRRELPKWWQIMPEFPMLMHDLLRREGSGELVHQWRSRELEALSRTLHRNQRRLFFALIASGLMVAAALLAAAGLWAQQAFPAGPWLWGSGALAVLAAGFMVRAWPRRPVSDTER